MPAKSKAQFKLMKGIAEGNYPSGYRGISKKVASEIVSGQKLSSIKRELAKRLLKKDKNK